MTSPNCLCKLRHFTLFLRDLILERAEWNDEEKDRWPILHDLIAITTLACLRNEGFKFLKKHSFGWVRYDSETFLREYRQPNGGLFACCRLNGFTKFIILFIFCCNDGDVTIRAEIHKCNDEQLQCYEKKVEGITSSNIHFALCGGYYEGHPVYLQYDIPRLLNSIYNVIDPIRDFITENWRFEGVMDYIRHVPALISDTFFGEGAIYDERELDEVIGEGKYKAKHTNPENLMFLSPEMCKAQINADLIIYHYRDNEKVFVKRGFSNIVLGQLIKDQNFLVKKNRKPSSRTMHSKKKKYKKMLE